MYVYEARVVGRMVYQHCRMKDFDINIVLLERENPWTHIKEVLAPEALRELQPSFATIYEIDLKSWRKKSLHEFTGTLADRKSMQRALEH